MYDELFGQCGVSFCFEVPTQNQVLNLLRQVILVTTKGSFVNIQHPLLVCFRF